MAPRNLSFSPSLSPLTQLGEDTPTSSNPEQPTPSSSFLPPPPPPVEQAQLPPPPPLPAPALAPKPRKKKPSAKAAVEGSEAPEEGVASGSPSARGGRGKGRGGGRGGATAGAGGKGSRGGKKAVKPAAEPGEPSNRYKDKFVELRSKYDEVNATKEANLATLNNALARLEKVQTENDAFLSSFITNIHTHPSLAYYLERSKTPPPEASLPLAPPAPLPDPASSKLTGHARAHDSYDAAHARESNAVPSTLTSTLTSMQHPRDEANGYPEDERSQKRARIE